MTFSETLQQLHKGQLVARAIWPNKSWFVFMTRLTSLPEDFLIHYDIIPDKAKRYLMRKECPALLCNPFLVMHLDEGRLQMGWHASMDEMMAADWVVLEQ